MRLGLLVILGTSLVHAAPPPVAKIDAVMKGWTGTKTPGCAVAVTQQGKVTFSKGYGMADLERGIPIAPSTVFDVGSVSKQFTAATIHLLAAEGKLSLADDIRKHLPQLPALSKQPVTIQHLLNHTGGLRDYEAILIFSGRKIADVASSAETLAALARQRGNDFEPGAKWQYSNTGYFVLAQIAERASKQAMADAARDRIFKPLGMSSTQILDDHARIIPGRAIAYAPTQAGWQLEMSQWEQTGDGAVQTTVLDLARWDANFTDKKVGGAALIDAMETRGKLANGKELDYATGLFHGSYRGQPTIGHGGAWAGYRASLVRFPKLRSSVIVLCNSASANPSALSNQIADAVFDKQLGPTADKPADKPAPTIELTSAELDAWVGMYRATESGEVVKVKRDDKVLAIEGGEVIPLAPTSKHAFRLGPTPFTIEFAGTKPKRTAVLKIRGDEEKLVEVAIYKPSAAELSAMAGRYWSPELQTMWTIKVEQGNAVLDGPNLVNAVLELTSPTEASNSAADVAFSISKQGLTLAGKLRVRFEKLSAAR
jgi:CubicO group peptidase (beta-lactamase class C family)